MCWQQARLGPGESPGDNQAMARGYFAASAEQTGGARKIRVAAANPKVRRLSAALALAGSLAPGPLQAQDADVLVTKVTDDRPDTDQCALPSLLPNPVGDVNNMPQGEVWIDVSDDGLLAAAAKDYRFSPLDDTTYNRRVWKGLYLSSDGGRGWRNLLFEESDPNRGIVGVTTGIFGQQPGRELLLTHETDPVVAFDRDGNVYTSAPAFNPAPDFGGSPSAIVVSRWDHAGRPVPGTTHFTGLEDDPGLFDDKNWIAVSRDAPPARTIVVSSWRMFTFGDAPPVPPGGYIAVFGRWIEQLLRSDSAARPAEPRRELAVLPASDRAGSGQQARDTLCHLSDLERGGRPAHAPAQSRHRGFWRRHGGPVQPSRRTLGLDLASEPHRPTLSDRRQRLRRLVSLRLLLHAGDRSIERLAVRRHPRVRDREPGFARPRVPLREWRRELARSGGRRLSGARLPADAQRGRSLGDRVARPAPAQTSSEPKLLE